MSQGNCFFLGLLTIEDRWKELAVALGYTRNEINGKFSSDGPIEQILTDYMSRGGDDNDFIRAMFQVARTLKLIPYEQMMENRENRRLENHIQCEFFASDENPCCLQFNLHLAHIPNN